MSTMNFKYEIRKGKWENGKLYAFSVLRVLLGFILFLSSVLSPLGLYYTFAMI